MYIIYTRYFVLKSEKNIPLKFQLKFPLYRTSEYRLKFSSDSKPNTVPSVLWKLFGRRARSLAETITSLVAGVDIRCKQRGCLACLAGEPVMSYLLKPDDSTQYVNLLTHCFVVVSDEAPPLLEFDPHNGYPQLNLVERTIDYLDLACRPNVICSDYNPFPNSSAAVKQLISLEWSILLQIGNQLMQHLLMYTSIFVPLPCKKYQQVAGSSIIELCLISAIRCTNSEHQDIICISADDEKDEFD